ncbi:unnamed protein product [Leptidea sinapis]|uniref:Uncharacterized protein n=1 Tax=Leptidea sinapis TaxID=189913 RepID=A0A5E4QR63_9NEOP|nr:unnamed protein product [Leptidea sinapis]
MYIDMLSERGFNVAYNKSVKFKSQRINKLPKQPWVKQCMLQMTDRRDALFNSWKKDPTNKCLRLEYNQIRNKIYKTLERSRNRYYQNEIYRNMKNPRKLWQIVNNICGRVSRSIDEIVSKTFDYSQQSHKVIANKFAQEFRNAVKAMVPSCPIKLLDPDEYKMDANVSLRFKNVKVNIQVK